MSFKCVSAAHVQTPVVALMIPILISWGRRTNISPKSLLIPLSYASIFGGTTTLIGTSTNLVVSGLQSKRYAGTPAESFNFFDITPYGVPYGVWGFLYVVIFSRWLLPKDTGSRPREDLLLAAEVTPESQHVSVGVDRSGGWMSFLKYMEVLWLLWLCEWTPA